MSTDIVLTAGVRTPLGNYGGSMKGVELTDMAAHAARASIAKSGIPADQFDHMVFTATVPTDRDTLFAARVVGVKSGIPESAGALHVVRACASGLQAILSAAQQIEGGHSQLAIAGGAECYSRAPHAVTKARWGVGRGGMELEDMLEWAYRCPFSLEYMGETAENLAEEYQYQREPMDEWAAMSQRRAIDAIDSGFLARQITPIDVPDGKKTRRFEQDESVRHDATLEKLARLRPAFREGGKVTAGNSSGVTDGAGFIVVGERSLIESQGGTPEAKIIDWHVVGVPPRIMGHGPVPAIQGLLDKTGLSVSDIDYFEINEAFAVVNLHAEKQLGIPRDIHNLYGGGISVGHPPGLTGVRMCMTAMEHLKQSGGKRAILSMCLGAGQGMAMLIERVDH
jgi:acetyl-CoA acetyltransferase family protein